MAIRIVPRLSIAFGLLKEQSSATRLQLSSSFFGFHSETYILYDQRGKTGADGEISTHGEGVIAQPDYKSGPIERYGTSAKLFTSRS